MKKNHFYTPKKNMKLTWIPSHNHWFKLIPRGAFGNENRKRMHKFQYIKTSQTQGIELANLSIFHTKKNAGKSFFKQNIRLGILTNTTWAWRISAIFRSRDGNQSPKIISNTKERRPINTQSVRGQTFMNNHRRIARNRFTRDGFWGWDFQHLFLNGSWNLK